jgi:hypothetical protein
MAHRVQVLLEDDIDGGVASETVRFGLDGTLYEIDLSTKNAAKLRKTLTAYTTAGRRSGRATSHTQSPRVPRQMNPQPDATSVIRNWARSNGFEVGPRGRISTIVTAAYHAAK